MPSKIFPPTARTPFDDAPSAAIPALMRSAVDAAGVPGVMMPPALESADAAAAVGRLAASLEARLTTDRLWEVAIDVAHADLTLRVAATLTLLGGRSVVAAADPRQGAFAAVRVDLMRATAAAAEEEAVRIDRVRRLGERFTDAAIGLVVGPGDRHDAATEYAHDAAVADEYRLADRDAELAALSAGAALSFGRQQARARWRACPETAAAIAQIGWACRF